MSCLGCKLVIGEGVGSLIEAIRYSQRLFFTPNSTSIINWVDRLGLAEKTIPNARFQLHPRVRDLELAGLDEQS